MVRIGLFEHHSHDVGFILFVPLLVRLNRRHNLDVADAVTVHEDEVTSDDILIRNLPRRVCRVDEYGHEKEEEKEKESREQESKRIGEHKLLHFAGFQTRKRGASRLN